MWQQQFTNLAEESTEYPIISKSIAQSTLTIALPKIKVEKYLKSIRGRCSLQIKLPINYIPHTKSMAKEMNKTNHL